MKLSEKLTHIIKEHGLSQQNLVELTGVSQQTISHLCNGKITNSKSLPALARSLSVDLNWLLDNQQGLENLELNESQSHKIPVFHTKMLSKDILLNGKIDLKKASPLEYEWTTSSEYPRLFAMLSTNNALKFRFGSNATMIFHTDIKPQNKDFVIAYIQEKDLFVYRDLEIKASQLYLLPLDKDIYMPITLKKDDLIVAILYEHRIRFRSI